MRYFWVLGGYLIVPDGHNLDIVIGESGYISSEGYLMNSKAEYQQGEVARVVVVRGLAE